MTVRVRPATEADGPIIVEFNCRLAEETENLTLDRELVTKGVLAALADPHKGPYFIAEASGQVVGQAQITFEWSDWRNGWMWWFQSVYVRKEARRRGVFRALYQHVYEAAKADPNVVGLRLYVEHANSRAQETYQQLGMTQTGYLMFERYPL